MGIADLVPDGPYHGMSVKVWLMDHGIIRHIDPDHSGTPVRGIGLVLRYTHTVMTVVAFPIGIGDRETIREGAAWAFLAFQGVEPFL